MTYEYDLDGFDPNKLDGPDRPEPGEYLFEVIEVQPEDPKSGALWADCEVCSGTTPGQEGKIHREYFALSPTALGRLMQFAVALGMTSAEELKRLKDTEKQWSTDWSPAIGRLFCGKLVPEEYQGKTRNKLNFNIWAIDSPKAKGIPLNEAKLAEFRRRLAMDRGTDNPFGEPGGGVATDEGPAADKQPPPDTPPFDAGDSPFGDGGDDLF